MSTILESALIVKTVSSLLLVVALLFVLLYTMKVWKRSGYNANVASKELKLEDSLDLGHQQKVVVVSYKGSKIMIFSSHNSSSMIQL